MPLTLEYLEQMQRLRFPLVGDSDSSDGNALFADLKIFEPAGTPSELWRLDTIEKIGGSPFIDLYFTNDSGAIDTTSAASHTLTDWGDRWRSIRWSFATGLHIIAVIDRTLLSGMGSSTSVGEELLGSRIETSSTRVTSLRLASTNMGTTPLILEGYNCDFSAEEPAVLSLAPGGGLGVQPADCTAEAEVIYTINGVQPDDQGRVWLGGDSCVQWMSTGAAAVGLDNPCEPCIDCADVASLYTAMKQLEGRDPTSETSLLSVYENLTETGGIQERYLEFVNDDVNNLGLLNQLAAFLQVARGLVWFTRNGAVSHVLRAVAFSGGQIVRDASVSVTLGTKSASGGGNASEFTTFVPDSYGVQVKTPYKLPQLDGLNSPVTIVAGSGDENKISDGEIGWCDISIGALFTGEGDPPAGADYFQEVTVTLTASVYSLDPQGNEQLEGTINESKTEALLFEFSSDGAGGSSPASANTQRVGGSWDNGDDPLTTTDASDAVYADVDNDGNIDKVVLIAGTSDSMTVTVKKYTPAGGAKGSATLLGTVSLSSEEVVSDEVLSGWTTAVSAGDLLEFTITSAPSTATWATISVRIGA